MRNIVIVLLGVLGCCTACTKQATLELNIPNVKALDVTLICGDRQLQSQFDSTGRVSFAWDLKEAGFCFLRYGSSNMRYYMEPGKSLVITDQRKENPESKERYRYEGDLGKENRLLNGLDFYANAGIRCTPETTLKEVWENIDKNVSFNQGRLDSMAKAESLSSDFVKIERERVNYMGWSAYSRFNKWDPAIFGYLEPLLTAKPELIDMKEYMDFMGNGIYVMGLRGAEEADTYAKTANQVKFIREHIGRNIIAAALLKKALTFHIEFNPGGVDEIDSLLGLLDYDFLEENPGFKAFYADWSHLKRGGEMPDFAFEYRDGKSFRLKELRGKYVFIDCWASWCGPCRAQVPALKKLEEKYKGKNIVFVGKTGDNNKDKWRKALEDLKLEGYQVCESNNGSQFDTFFKITGIPRFILLDKEGKILRSVMSRPSEPATEAYLNTLDI